MQEAPQPGCPALSTLQALAAQQPGDEARVHLEQHRASCVRCAQEVFAAKAGEKTGVIAGREGEARSASTPFQLPLEEELKPGSQLGRYTVLEKLGEGGMGVVYAAHDPQLHRKVAIKLLHAGTDGHDGAGKARLLREAQALAQLSHPNVVGVHEVGTFQATVFMAMEFVEGSSLRAWLKEKPRPWKDVLKVMTDAAEGLLAAHRKGLVHRDFKPDNVLLGEDGRVRVLDFGLARAASALGPETVSPEHANASARVPLPPASGLGTETSAALEMASSAGSSRGGSVSLETPLTQAGQVVGTLAYMAPEVLAGAPADVRSDIFAFCVSTYEALYGERPFSSSLRDGLAPRVLRKAPQGRQVPAWLRKVVLRGLEAKAEARYASMEQVLRGLASDPVPRRRRVLALVGTFLLLALAVAGTSQWVSRKGQLCRGEAQALRGVWDASAADRLQKAFLASGAPRAAAVFAHTRDTLNAYAAGIVGLRTEACEDTHLRGSQPDSVMALRMACLDRRLSELSAFVDVYAHADGKTVGAAETASLKLTPLDGCSDVAALRAPVPLPDAPAARAQVLQMQRELAHADALYVSGQYKPALAVLEPLQARAEALRYRPLEAEVAFARGQGLAKLSDFPRALEAKQQAYLAALAGTHTNVAVKALVLIMSQEAERGDLKTAEMWGRTARALIEGMGESRELSWYLEKELGHILRNSRPKEAEQHSRQALAVLRQKQAAPADLLVQGVVLGNLAVALQEQHREEEAIQTAQESLDVMKKALGRDHPNVAMATANLAAQIATLLGPVDAAQHAMQEAVSLGTAPPDGAAAARFGVGELKALRGELRQGLAEMKAALPDYERYFGAEGFYASGNRLALALTELKLGRLEEARDHASSALTLAEKGGVNAASLGPAQLELGEIALASGDARKARAYLESALATQVKVSGADSADAALASVALATFFIDEHAAAKALGLLEAALAKQKKVLSARHQDFGDTYFQLGRAKLELGRPADALPDLKEALQRLEAARFGAETLAPARFALARAEWEAGTDKAQALQLAARARAELAGSEGAVAKDVAQMDAWLAKRLR